MLHALNKAHIRLAAVQITIVRSGGIGMVCSVFVLLFNVTDMH